MNKYDKGLRLSKGFKGPAHNPIRNEPKVYGTEDYFVKQLIENRERAVIDLCKFVTGKRKECVARTFRCLDDWKLVEMAKKIRFIT